MLEALVVTLREGIEAALVVALIVTFLRREGAERHLPAVWAGIGAALAASVAGATVLYRVAVNEEALEGLLYLVSALLVASLVVWMWRHAAEIAGSVRGSLAAILARGNARRVAAGLFVFTFFMVLREGLETVVFLAALSLSSTALRAILGAAIGIAFAVAFGIFFVRGSVKIDLRRFFTVTGIALLVLTVQLLLNAYHELSEAQWLPANARTMAVVGPLVKADVFFLLAIVGLPLLALLVPATRRAGATPAEATAPNPAAERLRRAQETRSRRARVATAAVGLAALLVLGVDHAYSQPSDTPPVPVALAPVDGAVRIPGADLPPGSLRHFAVAAAGRQVRFIALRRADGSVAIALDACLICGDKGYSQEGETIVCRHCHSAVYPPSIGQPGGCNPIPLASHRDGDDVVIAVADLAAAAPNFRS